MNEKVNGGLHIKSYTQFLSDKFNLSLNEDSINDLMFSFNFQFEENENINEDYEDEEQ